MRARATRNFSKTMLPLFPQKAFFVLATPAYWPGFGTCWAMLARNPQKIAMGCAPFRQVTLVQIGQATVYLQKRSNESTPDQATVRWYLEHEANSAAAFISLTWMGCTLARNVVCGFRGDVTTRTGHKDLQRRPEKYWREIKRRNEVGKFMKNWEGLSSFVKD